MAVADVGRGRRMARTNRKLRRLWKCSTPATPPGQSRGGGAKGVKKRARRDVKIQGRDYRIAIADEAMPRKRPGA